MMMHVLPIFPQGDSNRWLDPDKIQSLAQQATYCLRKAKEVGADRQSNQNIEQHFEVIKTDIDELNKWRMMDPSIQYRRLFQHPIATPIDR
jgi:hypothetical protein